MPEQRQIRLPAHLAPTGYPSVITCPDDVGEAWQAAVAALRHGRTPVVSQHLHGAVVRALAALEREPSVDEVRARIPEGIAPPGTIERLFADPDWGSCDAADGNLWRLFRVTFAVLSHLLPAHEPA